MPSNNAFYRIIVRSIIFCKFQDFFFKITTSVIFYVITSMTLKFVAYIASASSQVQMRRLAMAFPARIHKVWMKTQTRLDFERLKQAFCGPFSSPR